MREPIAIVGIACRFPGAPDPESFWRLLAEGRDAVRETPAGRWPTSLYDPDPSRPGTMSTKWGGYLDSVDRFDPLAFGISPREAAAIDPQQRLLLELAWEALEDAGIPPDSLLGSRTGVYVGAMWTDYAWLAGGSLESYTPHTATGQDTSILAARVSYTLGLEGPSLTVNTACSSSLVALHLACQGLASGDSRVALAGGVNLILAPESTVAMSKFGAMSPRGRSRAFDAGADGYVRGEGGGFVVLKPLSRAIADGDRIYCLVRGSAVNNDGFSNGLTAPNPAAQAAVLRDAYARAGVEPSRVHYVEAHGTGTILGDPIEAGALGAVLGEGREPDRPLLVGSVKSNIGHLESAAGVAGLIKVALSLDRGSIPPSLHFVQPNPHIAFESLGLRVATELSPMPDLGEPVRAGVSSFGFGGTNSHVVLEAWRPAPVRAVGAPSIADGSRPRLVFVFSGIGSERPGMARGLLAAEPAFRAALERADRSIRAHGGPRVLDLVAGGGPVGAIEVYQPAIFAVQVALAEWWRSLGYEPDASVGHSMGEVAAACVAGALSLDDAAHVIVRRSALLATIAGRGGMALVDLPVETVRPALAGLEDRLSIAAVNGPDTTVLAGEPAALEAVLAPWRASGVYCRALPSDSPCHGPQVDPLVPELVRGLEAIRPRPSRLPMWSTVTARPIEGRELTAAYWGRNLRQPVLFADAIRGLAALGPSVFLEVSPHPLLSREVERLAGGAVATLRRDLGDDEALARARGLLEERGLSPVTPPGRPVLVPLSARSNEALRGRAQRLLERLGPEGGLPLSALGFNLACRRTHLDHRLAVVARTTDELAGGLAAFLAAEPRVGVAAGRRSPGPPPRIAFVFPGQGPQWWGMGRELLATDPTFREALEEADAALVRHGAASVLEELARGEAETRLERTEVAQPALFALGVALAATWRALGIRPDLVAGHSVGEAAAAHVAGALSLDDAARVVAHRARLMIPSAGKGKMVAVALGEREALRALNGEEGEVAVAATNSPSSTVLSGEPEALADVVRRLEACGVECRSLPVRYAFHGPQMDPFRPDLVRALEGLSPGEARVPFASTVTGGLLDGRQLGPEYWGRNLRQPVRFGEAVAALGAAGARVFLEVGPHPVLAASIREGLESTGATGLVLASLRRGAAERETVLAALGVLHAAGRDVDWGALFPGGGPVLPLPGYPWQRQRYWIDRPRRSSRREGAAHPLLGTRIPLSTSDAVFEAELGGASPPFLAEHRVFGQAVLPAAALVEMALGAAAAALGPDIRRVEDLEIAEPLVLADDGTRVVQTVLSPGPDRSATFRISARGGDAWRLVARGSLRAAGAGGDALPVANGLEVSPVREHYDRLRESGIEYGRAFQGVESLWRSGGEARAEIRLPDQPNGYRIHPALLDACFQVLLATLPDLHLPVAIESFELLGETGRAVSCHARLRGAPAGRTATGDVHVHDPSGRLVAVARGLVFRRATRESIAHASRPAGALFATEWVPSTGASPGAGDVSLVAGPGEAAAELLARALEAARRIAGPARLWISTRGAAADPDQAALWGFARVLSLEAPEIWGGIVDGDGSVPRLVPVEEEGPPTAIRPDRTYLVTGGLGALGLEVARWLASRGARHLALLGRNAPRDAAARCVGELEGAGVRIEVLSADVTVREALEATLARVRSAMPPLAGVFHLAGALDDALVADLTPDRVRRVLAPKLEGAANLDQATGSDPLDLFVLFSSAAAAVGSIGQAAYAAANAGLDALAVRRHARGLPAVSIQWGPWSGEGMASDLSPRALASWRERGVGAIDRRTAFDLLERALGSGRPVVGAWAPVRVEAPQPSSSPAAREELLASTGARRVSLFEDWLAREAASVLGLPPASLERRTPLNRQGIDSMMAVEIRTRLELDLGISIPMFRFLDGPSVAELAGELATRAVPAAAAPATPLPASLERPVSEGERALWFVHQTAPDSPAYNIGFSARVRSAVDVDRLRAAFESLVRRHANLRTVYPSRGGEPIAVERADSPADFAVEEAGGRPDEALRLAVAEAFHAPFDLEEGPLARMRFWRGQAGDGWMSFTVHHAAVDFWSLLVLVDELGAIYSGTSLPVPGRAFADVARQKAELLAGPEGERQWAYWLGELAGDLPVLSLATDRPRPAYSTYRGSSISFSLGPDLARGLKDLARAEGATLHATLLTAFAALLGRFAGQEEVLLGSLSSGRTAAGFAGTVGYFVNPIVLRARLAGEPSFREALRRTRRSLLGALEHPDVPFARIVERLAPARDAARGPLVSAMFVLQQPHRAKESVPFLLAQEGARMRLGGLEMESVAFEERQARFDLDLMMAESDGDLAGFLQYSTDLFDRETAVRLAGHFRTFLEGIVRGPDLPLAGLPLLRDEERRRIVADWNRTATPLRRECVHHLFEARVADGPDRIAAADGREEVSYRELDRRANEVAERLRSLGAGVGTTVALMRERGVGMLAAVLGAMKSGTAYVPVDPALPAERIEYLLADSRASIVVSERGIEKSGAVEGERRAPTPEDLAYVLYTSGSTGQPKGVEVLHGAVVNFLDAMRRSPGLTADDRLLAVTTLSFDIAGLELLLPLAVGAKVVIASREDATDGAKLARLLETSGATAMQGTPATWQMLLRAGWRGDGRLKVLCGGEPLTRRLANELLARVVEVWNLYGPTETTIWSARERVQAGTGPVPIGRPIENTTLHVLDRHGEPVPIGVAGELVIGGAGLARAYRNRPALTAERFVPDAFAADPGARLYRTGDLARYLPDGRIECLGRLDHQVKVRGYRIELGEIEATLASHPLVRQAVVTLRDDAPEKRLVAYVEPAGLAAERSAQGEAQVREWRSVWQETYGQPARGADPERNVVGWNASDTGQPIPEAEMKEWAEDSVGHALATSPGRVLEIGVGTGILLFASLPRVRSYTGIDFSAGALDYVRSRLSTEAQSRVTLLERPADDLSGLEDASFDALVVNSVVQYFPDAVYLRHVLEGALRVVRPGGAIVVGDVRSLPLLPSFHASVALAQAAASVPRSRLARRVERRIAQEEELLLDPAFFRGLPGVSRVEIRPRRGRVANELTRFRYQVTIHVGAGAVDRLAVEWEDARGSSLESVAARLERERPERLALVGVTNPRLAAARLTVAWLAGGEGPESAGAFRDWVAARPVAGIDPEALVRAAEERGYRARLSWARHDAGGAFDVVLVRTGSRGEDLPVAWPESEAPAALANDPLAGKLARRLVPELRRHAAAKLPEWMLPSAYVLLEKPPLTPSGKIDRKALPAPDSERPELEAAYVPPRGEAEERIAAVWREVLGLERVGVHDSFFDLGGHSLLLAQVHVRLARTFERPLALVDLLAHPTISALARFLTEGPSRDPTPAGTADRARRRAAATARRAQIGRERKESE